ncbi:DUF2057 family protein [Rouxiella sp. Mn2063]|uniref:DUF2057 family protein n=1 Tax=Rouxiella sp. Mn2063 TaxID=3395262 RepID=UPI003BC309E2
MKTGLIAASLFVVNLFTPAYATSLKLSTEIDVLVVDGKEMSGPILKGADSLELDGGIHQVLFQVNKYVPTGTNQGQRLSSQPMIVSFDAKNLKTVTVSLPELNNEYDNMQFNTKMNFRLLDENGHVVNAQRDTLKTPIDNRDIEQIMRDYNLSAQSASIAAFAAPESENAEEDIVYYQNAEGVINN